MTAPLRGTVRLPGDKSISHRALILAALCEGSVYLRGLGQGEDNLATQRVLGQLGVHIEREGADAIVTGVGLRGLTQPSRPLNCGNSGTTMRLMLGVLTGQPFEVSLIGDASLSRRPMGRVLTPLRQMGLTVMEAADGDRAPLRVRGAHEVSPLRYISPIASAQVKSAILLAGLWSPQPCTVQEPFLSRDHTERMLSYLGPRLEPQSITVPGDLSSAAFIAVAALLRPGSHIRLEAVGINPTRMGFFDILTSMGATVEVGPAMTRNEEPIADIVIRSSTLRGVSVAGALTVRAIDELPLLAVLAAFAEGQTVIEDAQELRVKESDRIAATARMLKAFGIAVEERPDGLTIDGDPERELCPGEVDASGDHRIAMCAKLLAAIAPAGSVILGQEAIASSFPEFEATLEALSVP